MDRATVPASQRWRRMGGGLAPGGQPRQQRRTRQDEENGTGRQGMFSTFLIIMEKGFAGIIGK